MININSQFESGIQSNLPSSEFVGSNPTLTTEYVAVAQLVFRASV